MQSCIVNILDNRIDYLMTKTRYVNHTGIMYEFAPDFGALLIYVEHRYFGKTQPFGAETPNCII